MNNPIFKDAPEPTKSPKGYQPTSFEYRHAVALMRGALIALSERYEREMENGEADHTGVLKFLKKTLQEIREVLGGK